MSATAGAEGVFAGAVGVAVAGRAGIAEVAGEIETSGAAGALTFALTGLVTISTIKSFSLIEYSDIVLVLSRIFPEWMSLIRIGSTLSLAPIFSLSCRTCVGLERCLYSIRLFAFYFKSIILESLDGE